MYEKKYYISFVRMYLFLFNKIRDSILVEVAVPGQRWEIEFMADGTIQIEKFFSDGKIENEVNLKCCLETSLIRTVNS